MLSQKNMRRLKTMNICMQLVLLLLFINCQVEKETSIINLEGDWVVTLDPGDKGVKEDWYNEIRKESKPIRLPSTLDEAQIGKKIEAEPKLDKETLYQLSRKYKYIGAAWYQRNIEVPEKLSAKELTLTMERVIWKSTVWIDGQLKGTDNSLIGAHRIKLGKLSPGKHLITICIDNRQQYDLFDNAKERLLAHAYTETTQTIWNGILGDFKITADETNAVANLKIYPNVENSKVLVEASIKNPVKSNITVSLVDSEDKVLASNELIADTLVSTIFTNKLELWDEFNTTLYKIVIKNSEGITLAHSNFGMRDIQTKENNMLINGKRAFLRGTLECSIFPLLGHPPLDESGWEKVFKSAKNYGLNHLRFHSWCPPEAAFNVADQLGFYLQVEMPNWSLKYGTEPEMVKWMEHEGNKMITEYGNHPSFCMMAMGNELEGDYELLENFVNKLKAKDPRHLYTVTVFTFQKPYSSEPDSVDQFWITQWTKNGWVRGQGVFDDHTPSFDKDYRASIEFLDIPLITHEIGQYSVYPNLKEIEKYTGTLAPLNFDAIKNDLEKKGRLEKADDYLKASGQLAKILYKEEIERALKTPGISGFQLLDLHDFPGQGTALVGMLDAFWDSKGIVSGNEFKHFCSELVPLLKFKKAVYTNDEVFKARGEVANYFKDIHNAIFEWEIQNENKLLGQGLFEPVTIQKGTYNELGAIEFDLGSIKTPAKLTVHLKLKDTDYQNEWSIWVYPKEIKQNPKEVVITSNWREAEILLKEGQKVLFSPNLNEVEGIDGKFVPVFWSPVHFPNQPGSMGLLIKNEHNAFDNFPTEFHSNWQWWDLCKQSKSLDVDNLNIEPIINVVDNFFKNRDLSNLFEAKSGNGTLIFTGIDLHSNLDKRVTANALLSSLLNYMNSKEFAPVNEVSFNQIKDRFRRDPNSKKGVKKSIYDN